MSEKRVQFSNIVQNQLPDYVKDEYPLISEFLKQYYIGQEYVSGPIDLIQNIDQYIKVDEFTNLNETLELDSDITSYGDVITIKDPQDNTTDGFPTSYGLIKIGDEIITYTGTTPSSFTGCIRGFSGITSYKSESDPESVVFESTNAGTHSAGDTITNLSCLFLKEFLSKTKYQILPGLEERPISENVNKNVFIKQSKDFYLSKGTDRSFEILFKALYEENVKIVRPGEYLFTPSNANYKIGNDLVVESIEGDPEDLTDATLYQDEYGDISKGYAPITNIEKVINNGVGQTYYKLSFDAGYNRDLTVDGSLYGNFVVHARTKLIGEIGIGQSTLDVDSTVGFGNSGELRVTYNDESVGIVSYTSKSLTQFYGCTNVNGIILDKSNIGINTFAWGRSFKDQTKNIKVRISSVLSGIEYPDNTTYYGKNDTAEIKTLGIGLTSFKGENWVYNIAPSYIIDSFELIDSSDYTYKITLNVDHEFKNVDTAQITGTDNITKATSIIAINNKKSFNIRGQGELTTDNKYTIKRNIIKGSSNSFPSISRYATDVQNVYKEKHSDNLLVASSSIPSYNSQPLNTSDRSITFSGTYSGEELDIGNHSFYTGDAVYYIPEKVEEEYYNAAGVKSSRISVNSSLFASDIIKLQEGQISPNEGIYFIKRINATTIKLAKSKSDIYNSKFISIVENTNVTDCIFQTYSLRLNTLGSQKLLREIAKPESDGTLTETIPGFTGILVNGVEILNYKSSEVVHYGELNSIEISSPGSDYDIINPQPLVITDIIGTDATGYIGVSGTLKEVQIIDPGFDYQETPTVRITGGNGSGALAEVRMTLTTHNVPFNSQSSGQEVGFGNTLSTIGFSTYHKFKNAEKVIYITDNQEGIVGLVTNTNYFVSHVDDTTVKLHDTQEDAIIGINTVVLTSGGVGRHSLQSYDKKSIVEGINVSNPGSGYENKKRTVESVGISTFLNEITIKNHGYQSGEIVKYTKGTYAIGGLSDGAEYYLTKLTDDKFKLSSSESLYSTKQYISFTSASSNIGKQSFNYPPISISLIGKVGISSIGSETFEAQVQPIVRGEITSIHLSNTGVGYGSSEIIGYKREPAVLLTSGTNAQVEVIVTDGAITELLILNGGNNYTSIPNLVLDGDGVGAVLTPIIENGSLSSIKIISGGSGYTSAATSITVIPAGSGAKFNTIIQTWRVNLFEKYFNTFTNDDGFIVEETDNKEGLQYSHLYSPRKLRENVYAVNQSGDVLYGSPDLKKVAGIEVESEDHSPIIGWAYDGNPIYGPYGYSTNNGGVVTQMKSGYKEESSSKENRPSLLQFPKGFFIEDFTYYEVSDQSVLDENNGRFGITPEFPNGTYAYFTTINNSSAEITGPFMDYKSPVFPYFIGNNFYSVLNNFNYLLSSNQDHTDLQNSNWVRNTKPYNLIEDTITYDYVNIPNSLNQTMDVKGTSPGKVNSIGIETGGDFYRIEDNVVFDSEDTGGYGVSARVSRILGKPITNISVASSTIGGVEIFPGLTNGEYFVYADNPHNLQNLDKVTITGLSTTSSEISGSYSIGVSSNKLSLVGIGTTSVGIASAGQTGIVTYMNVAGKLGYPDLRENDILGIGTEKVKVLNISPSLSRIKVLREYDGTVGQGHSAGTPIYEDTRKFTINAGFNTTSNFNLNKQLYFNPSESVGLGTSSGVGAGTTLIFTTNPVPGLSTASYAWYIPPHPRGGSGGVLFESNNKPIWIYRNGHYIVSGVERHRAWIESKRLYIPNHGLDTGDKLTYSSNGGDPIVSWIDPSSGHVPLTDGQTLYAAAISGDLVGLATVRVGMGTEGTFVGIASTNRDSSTLFFSGFGTGTYHSFQTNYDAITGEANRQLVTVETSQTHGLKNNDTVFIDVNPSIATTYTVQYNDTNRRVLVGIKTFTSVGVNTSSNTITITDHGFTTGEKIVHTATTSIQGLSDDGIYYIVKIDNNNFKLSDTYYNSKQRKPYIVSLGSTANGSIGPVNPPLKAYKDSTFKFDLSDSSLAWTWQGVDYSAFEFNFYEDSDYTKIWDKNINVKEFNVKKTGRVGIDADANITLTINKNTPEILYYKLSPVYEGGDNLPLEKKQISIDSEVISNNEIQLMNSAYNGKQTITIASTTSFTYTLPSSPERVSYASTNSEILSYETDSSNTSGPITKFQIMDGGSNYYELPGITTITSTLGKGADIKAFSNSIGGIKKIVVNDIGFDFPSDKTLNPSIALSQTQEIIPLMSLGSIGITSVGRGYTSAPELIVLDGKTGELVPDIDLDYDIEESQVNILKNAYGIYNVTPTILPIHNTNGVGISTIGFNTVTKSVTVTMASGFSTANSFPFAVNDRVMIEGISVGVGSTGKGYDSANYNYKLFTLTSVDENLGGIGTVAYSLANDLDDLLPGDYDDINSSGRIIPEKYFPVFNIDLKSNDYIIGETVTSDVSTGVVDNWNNKIGQLKTKSSTGFKVGDLVVGSTSKTQGIASSIRTYEAYGKTNAFSKVENGWNTNSGILNDNTQRLQDSDYYQNFSYALNSRVTYDTWKDVVSSLNHTLGFKKFSDLQIESSTQGSMRVGLSTYLTPVSVVNNLDGFANLNCVSGFDLVKENGMNLNGNTVSTEIIFSNRVLQDYMESRGNRVLSIDDISPQFNSHARPTPFSIVDTFVLSEMRCRKLITYVRDKRYYGERQLMLVDLVHDGTEAYMNQYARVESVYDQGSFDFRTSGDNGEILFYPTRYTVNDFWITSLSYNLGDNILGVGSTSVGSSCAESLIITDSTSVSTGTTTTVVSIANTYSSAKILVEVTPDISMNDNEFEFIELNVVHNGTDVEMIEYGQLTTNTGVSPTSGYGTYYPYLDGSSLKVDFIPNAGIGTTAAVNTITVGLSSAFSGTSGVGTVFLHHSKLETTATSIAASGSPTENVIADYVDTYDGAYCIIQVRDLTNNEYQLSEFAIVDDYDSSDGSGETYDVEWADIGTGSAGLGTIGSRITAGVVELVFTPNASIDTEVLVFMNAMKYDDDDTYPTTIDFTNAFIKSGFGDYSGTESDIMRAFNLTHDNEPIFERSFIGNDSSIVNISANTINIPNHFYVVGEKIKYYHVGSATSAIGITSTNFPGIGSTEYLPEDLFAVPINDDQVQIATTAEDTLKPTPIVVNFSNVGIGTSHRFVATNQNARILNAIDNLIQSPIVSTAVTTTLSTEIFTTTNLIECVGITSFYGGDLIKIGNEIMKIEGVGIGSTNIIRVRRPWLGTSLAGYGTGEVVTKVIGNYNIVDNTINFTEAPHGKRPLGSATNSPDDRDWTGITTSSIFQGRTFMKGGVVGSSTDTYSNNYIFDDISHGFNGVSKEFTLKSNGSDIAGISSDAIVLINDIWQGRGNSSNYTIEDSGTGISTITFVGQDIPLTGDVNVSDYPVGGVIVSVGSIEGLGYQPLVAAGGSVVVSTAGTITSISIGYSGSGYRSGIGQTVNVSIQQESLDGTDIVAIGTAIIGTTGSLTGVAVTNSQVFYAPKTITNVGYNSITGMSTVTTSTAHGLSVGNEVLLSGIAFTCTYSGSKSIAGFAYSAASGIATVTTSGAHGYSVNQDVIFTGIGMTCAIDPSTTHTYPRTTDPYYTGSRITSIIDATNFVTNVGVSTVPTFYTSGGTVQGAIIAPRVSDPAAGQATVDVVIDDNNFLVNTGISTRHHLYARGGKINKPLTVLFDDPLSYSNIPLIYSSSSSVGSGTSAVIDIQVGQGSSVIDFELRNTGYGYGAGEILTVPIGGTTGIPTTSTFEEFNLTIDNVFADEFTGWSVGLLQTLDNIERYIDGSRVTFPLSVAGDLVSILSRKGSKVDIEYVLVVFVNDILQKPGEGYEFPGGSNIVFTEPLKEGDTVKISFYKGGDSDVVVREILETVKVGDNLKIGYDPNMGQKPYQQENARTVTKVPSVDYVNTMPYYGPGNTLDSQLVRPVDWCRQTEDIILNEQIIGKDRELYEPNINPFAYIIKSVGIASTSIYVDNVRPFFDSQNENDTDLSFQNKVVFVEQENKSGAAATAVVSGLGTISSIIISDGGVGYTTATVSIASTIGINTTTQALGSVNISSGIVTGVTITNPGVGYTNTNIPTVLITPPSTSTETNTVSSYQGDSGVIVGVGTTTDGAQSQLIFDMFIPLDSDLRNSTLTGTAVTLSSLNVDDYFMVFESSTGSPVTSLDSAGSTNVGIGASFIDNVYSVQSVESVEKNVSGITTYVRRVFVNTQTLMPYGTGITTSDYLGEFSWGKIILPYRSAENSYTAYTMGGIGTITSGISTSMMVQRFDPLKSKNYSV